MATNQGGGHNGISFFHNVTSILTKDLLTAGDNVSNLKSITLANVDTSNDAEVDLFLNKGSDNFYILKKVSLPLGFTLVLGPEDNIAFLIASYCSSISPILSHASINLI